MNKVASYVNNYKDLEADLLNAVKRISDWPSNVPKIIPGRRVVHEGVLRKSQERRVFLFNDMIMCCVNSKKDKFAYKAHIVLDGSTWVQDLEDGSEWAFLQDGLNH